MPAYFIALVDVHDVNAGPYGRYREQVAPIVAAHGGRFVVRGGAQAVLEGEWPESRTVVIVFDDMAQARAFYDSPDYQAIVPLRQAASSGRVLIVEGLASTEVNS